MDGNLICLCVRHHERAESGEIPKKELYELVKTRDDPPGGVVVDFWEVPAPTVGLSIQKIPKMRKSEV